MLIVIHQEKTKKHCVSDIDSLNVWDVQCTWQLGIQWYALILIVHCMKLEVNKRCSGSSAEKHNFIRMFISNYHTCFRIAENPWIHQDKLNWCPFFSFGTPSSVFHVDLWRHEFCPAGAYICVRQKSEKDRMSEKEAHRIYPDLLLYTSFSPVLMSDVLRRFSLTLMNSGALREHSSCRSCSCSNYETHIGTLLENDGFWIGQNHSEMVQLGTIS